jgi:hypothetical protein
MWLALCLCGCPAPTAPQAKSPAPASTPVTVATPTADVRIQYTDAPQWCYADDNGEGGCAEDKPLCDSLRSDLVESKSEHGIAGALSSCAQQSAVACFDAIATVSGGHANICFTTLTRCDLILQDDLARMRTKSNPDVRIDDPKCFVLRTKR